MFNFTKEMAKILRRLRENANLTQKEVASRMGVKTKYGQSLIAQIEMGKVKNPSLRTILDYIRACGGSWVEFFKELDRIDFKLRHEKMVSQVKPPSAERKIQRDAMKYEIGIEFPSKQKEEIDFDRLKKQIKNNVIILLNKNQTGESEINSYQKFALEYFDFLATLNKAGMKMVVISGNHEKSNYSSKDSFIDPFKNHPALGLIREYEYEDTENRIRLHFIPYFEENVWLEEFKKIEYLKEYKNILMSHQAVQGSVNNDGSKVNNSIKVSLFKDFYKVFLGHYHNEMQVGSNIYHLPSIQANNYGENNEKGFTILYEDGSHELIKSDFKEYYTIKVDLDKVNNDDLTELKKQGSELIKEVGANVRFKFEGSNDKVLALKIEEFISLGIDVKKEHKTVIQSIEKAETGEVIVYNDKTILSKFDSFCETEKYPDKDYGKECLIKKLKGNDRN